VSSVAGGPHGQGGTVFAGSGLIAEARRDAWRLIPRVSPAGGNAPTPKSLGRGAETPHPWSWVVTVCRNLDQTSTEWPRSLDRIQVRLSPLHSDGSQESRSGRLRGSPRGSQVRLIHDIKTRVCSSGGRPLRRNRVVGMITRRTSHSEGLDCFRNGSAP
jgi:hypothetical protein